MTTKQHDAAELAARLARAYPSLSAYTCAERALALLRWASNYRHAPNVTLQSDPRGPVLLLQLPGETEARAV